MTPHQLHRETPFRFRRWPAAWQVFVCAVGAMALSVVVMAAMMSPGRRSIGYSEAKSDVARAQVKKYALEAFPQWVVSHPDRACPWCLHELTEYMNDKSAVDPWGREYRMHCDNGGVLVVQSFGEDGLRNTSDDIWSNR